MNGAGASRHWVWATAGAVVLVTAGLTLVRGPGPTTPRPEMATRGVSVKLEANPALRDEAAIFDPTPLFLPTEHNAAPARIRPREQGSAFPDFPSKLGFNEAVLTLDALALPKPVAVPRDPAVAPGVALALPTPGSLAVGMGRTDAPLQPLKARGAFVEITAANGGRQVWAHALAESVRPPGNGLWQPLEFLAAVDPAGLVGPLVLTTRSGVEEVDGFFQNYLAQTLRVGERLAPGFYRISVGP